MKNLFLPLVFSLRRKQHCQASHTVWWRTGRGCSCPCHCIFSGLQEWLFVWFIPESIHAAKIATHFWKRYRFQFTSCKASSSDSMRTGLQTQWSTHRARQRAWTHGVSRWSLLMQLWQSVENIDISRIGCCIFVVWYQTSTRRYKTTNFKLKRCMKIRGCK